MFNALQRLLRVEHPPNKVLEIKGDSLGTLQILARDDGMLLYAPPMQPTDDRRDVFEIVLQRPASDASSTAFSLFRTPSQTEAEEKFNAFTYRVPVLVSFVKDYLNVAALQKVCDILTENPSWSIAHLVAYLNLVDYVGNPHVVKCIDYEDHVNGMTPFQLAIKMGNMAMVQALLPHSNLNHLDNIKNSAYHYAAGSSKDIINLLVERGVANLNGFNIDGYTPLHMACLADKPDCVNALLMAGADVNLNAHHTSRIYKATAAPTPTSVATFMKSNASKMNTQDMKHGGTPLHWCSSRETLQALIEQGCDINATNFDERTALHVMVARGRFECVVALLAHDADVDVLDKDGNSPLHIAIEKRHVSIVQCLVVFSCDVNLKNKSGKSPRHMVGKESSSNKEHEILYILHSVGAKRCSKSLPDCPPGCNASGTYNGIPPEAPEGVEQREHIENMLSCTSRQAMANLGTAAIDFLNDQSEQPVLVNTEKEEKGQSIMDSILAMFSTKIVNAETDSRGQGSSESLKSASAGSPVASPASRSPSEAGTPAGSKASPIEESPYGRGRLLCLDGGGIRGLVLVQMLLEIERLSNAPITHLFDWIAGTSTGGILALGLGCGKTLRQCMGLYIRMKEQCFVGSRPYASEPFEAVLKDLLGEYTIMTDIKNPKIMVTGVMADRKPVDLHLFRNYTSASEILGIVTSISNRRVPPPPPSEQLVWRAARATGAAPSYFRAFGRFLDGGLIANNPTLDAITEIHEYNMALRSVGQQQEAVPVSVVVSLGTGHIPVTELKDIDVFRPESIWDTARLAYGISTLGNLLVDQATSSDGRVVDRARAWCSTIGVPYYRFNPQLSEDVAMDEKNDQKLINMLWLAKAYMHTNRTKVLEMLQFLQNQSN